MSYDFQEEVKLDKYALDQCALEQPELFAKWALCWADAIKIRDSLKDELAIVRSECDGEIRAEPHNYGWANPTKAPTESFISSAIVSHEKYIEVNDNYLAACHECNVLQVAKEAFDQRRRMIEVLADLYQSSYYSGNPDFDKGYQKVVEKGSTTTQSEGLEKNPRLKKKATKDVA